MSEHRQYSGLSDSEVLKSRELHGINILTPPAKVPLWRQFLGKFSDPLIIILLVAGVLSVGISLYEYYGLNEGAGVFFEPVGIFIAILLATGLAFVFELKADREFALLNQVNDDEPYQVIRNGSVTMVPKKDIVVGDIVLLNTGEEIPADGKLLEAVTLNVDESTLTGEPMCHKTVNPDDFDPDATFASDEVMRGTKVMEGHGVMEVTAVGDMTENGKVFVAAQIDDGVKTPLDEQLQRLGGVISKIAYLCAALIVAGRVFIYFTNPAIQFDWMQFLAYLLQTLMIAVTLVVVSVPEGLPMAVTLALAYSMRRMLKTNNLVRKMHACETMGATTVICTDKTGTLTQNQMRVSSADFYGLPDGRLSDDALSHTIEEGIAVNSTAQLDLTDPQKPAALGNPTEGALLLWLAAQGVDYRKLRDDVTTVEELPFSTERKYMATVIRDRSGRRILYVKGAPEIVFSLCRNYPAGVTRQSVDTQLLAYQNQAMRTLGFAYQLLDGDEDVIADGKVTATNLSFLGIVAIADPVRQEVPDAVREVIDAGIKVKIVTGDTPGTAKEIGRQIGLWTPADTDANIITGPEFEKLSDDELKRCVGDFKIIARARPLDKKRLVEALQSNGEVVAVTGDGTNDAPALKAAQVGLSMGDGTSVAKEASDITIVDNSFSSIGRAVMWGRSLYQNIQRFILFQMTVNVVASLIVLVGAFMGMQSPLTVTQMLWVNLIMDTFAAVALASLPPSRKVMEAKPRRRSAFIITRSMWTFILATGAVFFLLLVGLLWYLDTHVVTSLSHICTAPSGLNTVVQYGRTVTEQLSPYELSLFFSIFVFLQFWNLFNARSFSSGRSAFHFQGCQGFLLIALIILVGQIAIVQLGGAFFNVSPLGLTDWLLIILCTSPVLWIGELIHLISGRRHHI